MADVKEQEEVQEPSVLQMSGSRLIRAENITSKFVQSCRLPLKGENCSETSFFFSSFFFFSESKEQSSNLNKCMRTRDSKSASAKGENQTQQHQSNALLLAKYLYIPRQKECVTLCLCLSDCLSVCLSVCLSLYIYAHRMLIICN